MPLAPVPRQWFTGLGRIVHDDPRGLVLILNEIIAAVNAGALIGVDHLIAQFDHTAWAGGSLPLGTCPGGRVAECCVVEVVTPFNGGAEVTVGDAVAQGRLQAAGGSALWAAGLYVMYPHHLYATDEALSVYFSAGAPSAGAGRVIAYLS